MSRLTRGRGGRSDNNKARETPYSDASMVRRIGSIFALLALRPQIGGHRSPAARQEAVQARFKTPCGDEPAEPARFFCKFREPSKNSLRMSLCKQR